MNKKNIPLLITVLLPFILRLPAILGYLHTNPMLLFSGLSVGTHTGILQGLSANPGSGTISQALGHRAVLDLFSGKMPWWNPYEGVGLPLAGDMQSASLFPLTLLLYFSSGQLYEHIILQVISGVGTYLFLRKLKLGPTPSLAGGVLYEFNGTFAWLGSAPSAALAFLPLLLLGIEKSKSAAEGRKSFGWGWISLSIALSLYAGFPEVAYIDGIFALLWTILRIWQSGGFRKKLVIKTALGAFVGCLLSLPIVIPFLDYLQTGFIKGHSGAVASLFFPSPVSPMVAMPYIYGNNYAYHGTMTYWGGIGGYLGIGVIVLSIAALFGKHNRVLRIVLFVWICVGLGRSFGIPVITQVVNHIPLIVNVKFTRYSAPSWELAGAVLSAFAINDLQSKKSVVPIVVSSVISSIVLLPFWLFFAHSKVYALSHIQNYMKWPIISVFLYIATPLLILLICFGTENKRLRAALVSTVVVVEAMGLFTIPILAAPTSKKINTEAVGFLKRNLHLSRFYTLGPFAPNYGTYFGDASINTSDLPIAQSWHNFIHHDLDPYAITNVFTGNIHLNPKAPSPSEELINRLKNYEWIGVKYVVTYPGQNPFAGTDSRSKLVYKNSIVNIYQLANPAPFFQTLPPSSCKLDSLSQNRTGAYCNKPAILIRRSLFSPGWQARLNGHIVPIDKYKVIFQSIEVNKGSNQIVFSYAPPHIDLGYLAFFLGCLFLISSSINYRLSINYYRGAHAKNSVQVKSVRPNVA
ncbi:MAG: YfhO family protein [Actinobacteria bacterium]|nr:YfhO family protein [Actinomycetota bacterium]MCL6104955.1 YfhO family protein [Actinomycetota bacterium]